MKSLVYDVSTYLALLDITKMFSKMIISIYNPIRSVCMFCCCRCQVTSVVSNSVRHHGWQPTRLPCPWDSPGKNTRVGCHFLLQCMKVKMKMKSLSHIQLLATPWASAYQAPPSMGFSRQEYWSGVPLPPLIHVPVTSNSSTLVISIFILDIWAGAY